VKSGKMSSETLQKFENALGKFASGQGKEGIKPLTTGMKIGNEKYYYELKILSKEGGGYRLYGNKSENGQVIFQKFQDSH